MKSKFERRKLRVVRSMRRDTFVFAVCLMHNAHTWFVALEDVRACRRFCSHSMKAIQHSAFEIHSCPSSLATQVLLILLFVDALLHMNAAILQYRLLGLVLNVPQRTIKLCHMSRNKAPQVLNCRHASRSKHVAVNRSICHITRSPQI